MGLPRCILALLALHRPLLAAAYSWKFEQYPAECGTVKVTIVGSDGTPPYRMGIVPFGGSPLPDGQEVRKVLDLKFNDSTSLSFTLPYPASSQFVAVVSDHDGADSSFGNGGASVPVNVQPAPGNSPKCLPEKQGAPPFTFSVSSSSFTTCQEATLTWDSTKSQGDVKFWAVIPGGNSFTIPTSSPTTLDGSPGYRWTPDIRVGVNLLVVSGDNRGFGTGGSFQGSLQPGNGTITCLKGDSPISTAGSPAGGAYPTNNSGGTTQSNDGGTNVGAIVGGVIAGIFVIALLGILAWFLLRRRRRRGSVKEQPVDLLDTREVQPAVGREYIPEPFHMPEPSERDMSETSGPGSYLGINMADRRQSGYSLNTQTRPSTEGSDPRSATTGTGKSAAALSGLRPVNIIQHEDAGPSASAPEPEAETVELPPAYTNIRR